MNIFSGYHKQIQTR